jgi:phage terminase large subunit-like protein
MAPSRSTTPALTIVDAVHDAHLFRAWFQPLESWSAWLVVLRALFGLAMTPSEIEIFQRFTGRSTPPTRSAREAWLIVGRRGGKSRIAALIAVFVAAFRDYRHILAPGEKGVVMVLAADREQARVVFQYVEALIGQVPMLKVLVVHQTKEEIHLRNRVVIRVHTSSFRAVRGFTILAAVCDELAFWHSEDSANPDVEILHALRPAMSTVPNPLLLCISSPYARRGALWEAHHRHFGKDGDPVLVWSPTPSFSNASSR